MSDFNTGYWVGGVGAILICAVTDSTLLGGMGWVIGTVLAQLTLYYTRRPSAH
jgi:hypothetical protein